MAEKWTKITILVRQELDPEVKKAIGQMLADATHEFRTRRAHGDPHDYAREQHKRYHPGTELDENSENFLMDVQYNQARFKAAKAVFSGSHMATVEEIDSPYGEE